jgi:FkbM family methyltransferase
LTAEQNRLIELSEQRLLPLPHQHYLYKMRNTMKINPRVIYDIGACVLHWTTVAREVWGNAHFVVFDAMQASEFLFQRAKLDYACVTLGAENDVEREFWENTEHPGGNSFYAENPQYSIGASTIFTPDKLVKKKVYTLDFIVNHFNFALPNLCKMDVQGAEMEILKGAQKTLANCEHLILELQEVDYNKGAPKAPEVIEYVESIGYKLVTPKFSANTNDGDYHFQRR